MYERERDGMGMIKRIHEMLVKGEITCVELTERFIEAINDSDKELNAYITVTPETALAQAEVDLLIHIHCRFPRFFLLRPLGRSV